jgi:hypothetical protein
VREFTTKVTSAQNVRAKISWKFIYGASVRPVRNHAHQYHANYLFSAGKHKRYKELPIRHPKIQSGPFSDGALRVAFLVFVPGRRRSDQRAIGDGTRIVNPSSSSCPLMVAKICTVSA